MTVKRRGGYDDNDYEDGRETGDELGRQGKRLIPMQGVCAQV